MLWSSRMTSTIFSAGNRAEYQISIAGTYCLEEEMYSYTDDQNQLDLFLSMFSLSLFLLV